MPRLHYKQTSSNSCGAVATMVALYELLGRIPLPDCSDPNPNQTCEFYLWNTYGDLPLGGGDKQCPPISIVNFLHTLHSQGLSVAIVHDPTRVEKVLTRWQAQYTTLRYFYTHHFTGLLEGLNPPVAVQSAIGDFDNNERVLILCLIEGGPQPSPLHYLLARKDGNSYWVMNPDGGIDTNLGRGGLPMFLEDDVARGVTISGPENTTKYIYTGIALIVRKNP